MCPDFQEYTLRHLAFRNFIPAYARLTRPRVAFVSRSLFKKRIVFKGRTYTNCVVRPRAAADASEQRGSDNLEIIENVGFFLS